MRLYLSATMDIYRARVALKVPRLLMSYESEALAKRFPSAAHACGTPKDWCVDSGAHFFISEHYKKGITPMPARVEAHLNSFIGWLRAGSLRPTFVVELDLQDLYGADTVNRWRGKFRSFEASTGIPVCYVWHPGDGYNTWRAMLDSPHMRMLGLSAGHGTKTEHVRKYVLEAYEEGKPVHGFASFKLLRDVPFFSVDSTSWGSGAIFGRVVRFDARKGMMQGASVGRKGQAENRDKAIATLVTTSRGAVQLRDGRGIPASGQPGLQRLYQQAVDEYGKMEAWYTAYWRGKGVDWEKRVGFLGKGGA
jgi:hypothetical protein